MLQQRIDSVNTFLPFADRLIDSLAHPILVIDASDIIVFANIAAGIAFGDVAIGRCVTDRFGSYRRAAAGHADTSVKPCLVSANGLTYEATFSSLDADLTCISLVPGAETVIADPSAARDDLTNLVRRNEFTDALSRCLAINPGAGHVAVHCLDLDRFKMINDTLGHGTGDDLLRKVADRLRAACRKEDVIARLGGDEFAILQPDIAHPDDAHTLAARIVDLVGRTYVLNAHTINIGVSVGVALNQANLQPRDLIRNADVALYEAKRAGRGRYEMFKDIMANALQERRELEIDLRRSLALKQFTLNYQPFVDVANKQVKGFEALLRWCHPVRGNVPPLAFIPLAEETGLIVKIGDWVIKTACAEAASWDNDCIIAVNVSPLQLKADNIVKIVTSALAQSGLAPTRLEIEITESALLDDTQNVLTTLGALRDLGVRISMDDFGTGYSSLSYLQKFPFDKIKIDRSFVTDAGADSEAILRAVSGLGKTLGMQITAEGVETIEQFDRISNQSCTHVQGFLTGRPMAAEHVRQFLTQETERLVK